MKHIAVIYPLEPEREELTTEKYASQYRISFLGRDNNKNLDQLDVLAFIRTVSDWCRKNEVQGIMSSRDYPGSIIAHAVANIIDQPNVSPSLMIACQHKYICRQLQTKFVPQATPQFFLLDPTANPHPSLDFPFFIKPVKSFFSIASRKVSSFLEFQQVIQNAHSHFQKFTRPLNDLIACYAPDYGHANYLIGEELLKGIQVTVEGYMYHGAFTLIGITDSIMYPHSHSFQCFRYPSSLPFTVQKKMAYIMETFLRGIGFDNAIANIEMMYDPSAENIKIIEVNPRMCAQFADLMEKIHGTSTYDIALALCCGEKPLFRPHHGQYKVAASFALRVFEDKKILRIPQPEDLKKVYKIAPDARIELCGKIGGMLSDELQDEMSFLYCIINIAAQTEQELQEKFKQCRARLPFEFESFVEKT